MESENSQKSSIECNFKNDCPFLYCEEPIPADCFGALPAHCQRKIFEACGKSIVKGFEMARDVERNTQRQTVGFLMKNEKNTAEGWRELEREAEELNKHWGSLLEVRRKSFYENEE